MLNTFKKVGPSLQIVLILLLIYAVTSKNPLLMVATVITPFILLRLLWKEDESPFLFIASLLQWFSITIKVFYSNFQNIDFELAFDNTLKIYSSFYYSLGGLICLSIGIHLIIKSYKLKPEKFNILALRYDSRKIVPIYILIALAYPIIYDRSFMFGGLQQPISKLADFKWMVFFIFMLSCFYTKQYKLFALIALLEILLSFTGFFSNFKDYFVVTFGGLLIIYGRELKFKQVFPLAGLAVFCIYLILIWQYVKPEYRNYLSGGEMTQNTIRGTGESLSKLGELAGKIDREDINAAVKTTVDRLSYIDFFSATIDYVPRVIPHTHGRLWSDAVGRVLQPRILFPNKKAIDDSETTRQYSGMMVAGTEQGTSISLGYMTENYIDFGMPGMFISLFGYGLLIGLVYKYVMTSSPDKLIGTAMIIPLFILIYLFESALNKLIGGLLMYLLIYELIRRFALKKFLQQIKI
jgi:hypothetical protein